MKKKTAQDAFIEQAYGSLEDARLADEMADARDSQSSGNVYDVLKSLGRSFGDNNIQDKMDIPTKKPSLKPDNSQYKSYFKDYDHSLDRTRKIVNNSKGINVSSDGGGSDGVEWGDLHDSEIGNWEIET